MQDRLKRAKWLVLLFVAVPLVVWSDSTVDTVGGGGGGASSVSELGDDIACGADEFVKRNAADDAWECAAGAVGGDALTSSGLNQFATTTSANLRTVITDPSGSGALVFANSPVLVSPALGTPSSGDPVNLSGSAPNVTAGAAVLASQDPANCPAGEVAGGVSQAFTAEDCLDPVTLTEFNASGGAGLACSAGSCATASQEAAFLADGGSTSLTCGGGTIGKAQVMDDGTLQTCDGATTAVLRTFTPSTVWSGSTAVNPSSIGSGACNSADTTATATGVASTDVISWTPNADISSVTGYAPVTTGGAIIYVFPTTNTVNFRVCNPTSSSVDPVSITINWRVER